jgi:pilus assembly protein Flp/PilA
VLLLICNISGERDGLFFEEYKMLKGPPALRLLIKFAQNEAGATAIEYALIALLIAAVVLSAISYLGVEVAELYDTVSGRASDAMN